MTADPTLLAFDTSGPYCAAALLCGGTIQVRVEDMARGQGERLMGLLEGLLAQNGKTWADLDAIGVGTGPGNFTGIRIAVSATRGLALGLGKPAVGVTGFAALAHGHPYPFAAQLPAPRDQRYVQDFDAGSASAPRLESGSAPPADPHKLVENMARIAAARLHDDSPIERPAPMYVRAPNAAPSRDPAPVILP